MQNHTIDVHTIGATTCIRQITEAMEKKCPLNFDEEWKEPYIVEYATCPSCNKHHHSISFENMISFKNRFDSFEKTSLPKPRRQNLALMGYFRSRRYNMAQCYCCGFETHFHCPERNLDKLHFSAKKNPCEHIEMLKSWAVENPRDDLNVEIFMMKNKLKQKLKEVKKRINWNLHYWKKRC